MIGHLHAIKTGKHWSCLALSPLGNTYRIQNNTSKYALYNNETGKDTYPHNGDKIGQWCVCVFVCVLTVHQVILPICFFTCRRLGYRCEYQSHPFQCTICLTSA